MTIGMIIQELNQDLKRFALHIAGDFHKAEDLYHDALVKAIENEAIFETMVIGQAKAWLFRCMKNKFIDDCRRIKHENALYQEDGLEDFQDKQVLKMLLNKLSEEEAKIISLRYFSGYKSHEIGKILSMNPSTVRNRITSAIGKLRLIYQED